MVTFFPIPSNLLYTYPDHSLDPSILNNWVLLFCGTSYSHWDYQLLLARCVTEKGRNWGAVILQWEEDWMGPGNCSKLCCYICLACGRCKNKYGVAR